MKETLKAYRGMDRNIWIRFIGESINGIAMMMIFPFLALYLSEQLTNVQIGIVMAASPVAGVVGSMLGGRIADIYGRKPIMIISMIGNAVVMLGYIFFDGFFPYIFLSVFLGLFNSLFHPAASAMVADVTEEDKRTEAFGLLRMGHNIGAAIGPILGASIVFFSKTIIFMIGAASLFIYAIVVLVFISETLPSKTGLSKKNETANEKEKLPSPFTVLIKDKLLFLFIMTGIVISMGFSQTEGMLPLHFQNELPSFVDAMNPYPYLMAFNGTLVVLFQFAISRWAADRPMGRVMLYGSALFGFGLLSVGWLPILFYELGTGWWTILAILLVVYGLYTLGEMLLSPVQMTFVANLAPEHLRGTYMGAASLQWILGNVSGPILAGYLLDRQLGNVLFTVLGVGCVIAGFVYVSLDRWVEEHNKRKDVSASA